ncbi:hypothetical protein B0I35DRAFT_411744 [Stachybotrys elegans]|uniref:Large ribosomal subunit protein mL50 n=1 Tax=Stachybotrys elegans TaxID=80388 RepID=A0A8K0SLC1_9HYPO|nr:hypothetical protein B0I35DRAFT_411744 [Stachybotrys elegans]
MSRISRVRRLQSLQAASVPNLPLQQRTPFLAGRTISSTSANNNDWIRKKLWKGEAPGAADPYTQRPEEVRPALPDEFRAPTISKRAALQERTRIVLPPSRTEAPSEQEAAASLESGYVPATTAEGLEQIMPLKKWWEQEGHWGEESEFKGFANPTKTTDSAIVEVYLRRAVVEALALKQAGKLSTWVAKQWPQGDEKVLRTALRTKIQVTNGQAEPLSDPSAVVRSVIDSEAPKITPAKRVTAKQAAQMIKAWDASWQDLVLDDELKFALRKRLFQFTGNLVSDAKLGAARTVRNLLTLASTAPKPKKLVEELEQRGDLPKLANVKVHGRRVTTYDQEVAVGRWKLIEEELTKRGLPLKGTNGLPSGKEQQYLLGR